MTFPPWLRHLLPPLAILGIGAALLAAMVLTSPEPPARSEDERVWRVEARTVEPRSISPTLTLYGRLESPRASTLSAGVTADVREVAAREGRSVAPGEELVALERSDLAAIVEERRADLVEAEAQVQEARVTHQANQRALEHQRELVELAKRGVERAERLAEQEVGAPEQVDAARQAVEQARLALNRERLEVETFDARIDRLEAQKQRARARLEQAKRNLARTRVTAPFAGRITGVEVAPGDRVRPGDPLVAMYDTSALEVRATIPGPRAEAVRHALAGDEGVTAEVRMDGRTLAAQLDRLGGRSPEGASGVEGLFRIQGEAPEGLALGRFAEVVAELPPRPGLVAVPPAALYEQDRIYVVRDGRLAALTVERAGQKAVADGPGRLLLRAEGLRSGDRVVTTQLPNASEGLRVRVADEAGDA
ncbi:efflux RND transporter periplasmic adaptor subunit [Thiohalorhabdus sp.]|uniref:efflux RND transporter periplasmic adaptor subunit n=1 Tax=Thiohalorhabdus sp. TaxID=3094134 RepID=UPI002FC35135